MSEGLIALYRTAGKRRERHRLVLYLNVNKDWGARNLARNGNEGGRLITTAMTTEALAYRTWRACSLQYDGKKPADATGLRNDLLRLGVDEATTSAFVHAAAPHW